MINSIYIYSKKTRGDTIMSSCLNDDLINKPNEGKTDVMSLVVMY